MNLMELREKPHLSASSIRDYTDCGLLYRLSRVDRKKPDYKPDTMALGSAIHNTLAEFNIQRSKNIILSTEDVQSIFESFWIEASSDETIRYSKGSNEKNLLTKGKKLLEAFCDQYHSNAFRVLAVEEAFEFYIDGVDVPIIGAADLIEEDDSGTVIISDYKTSAKSWSPDQVDNNHQVTVYQMAAQSNGFSDREILLRIDCLIKTKVPKFEQYYTIRTEKDIQNLEVKIRNVWEAIEKEIFIPADGSWKCNNCMYKSHCEEWFGGMQ
jgi:putative RecB family exonuclease